MASSLACTASSSLMGWMQRSRSSVLSACSLSPVRVACESRVDAKVLRRAMSSSLVMALDMEWMMSEEEANSSKKCFEYSDSDVSNACAAVWKRRKSA